ncbi:WSC-domain-containing protein [Cadophora sp. DSE1049]|nr:WSC-domain-containing protein [Cadophora sp. DSE1049]
MKLSSKSLWLAACVGTAFGSLDPHHGDAASEIQPNQSSHMYASSHTLVQRQPTRSSHMYASSHTLAQRQVTASPALATSVSLVTSVVSGLTVVVPTNIVITLTPAKNSTSTSGIPATGIAQIEAITTVTSFLGGSPTSKASTRSTGSAILISTSTVDEVVTVTSMLPSVTFPDPQSQVQGSTSGPSISFVPVASTTAKSAPTSTTKPKTVPSAGGYKYLGCFAEGLVVRALGEAFFPNDENTIERCITACYPYKYAGAEYGRECWCGNELNGASKVSDSDFCNMPCAGNREQYCGGIVALNVYVAEDASSASFVPVTVSGTASLSGKTSSTTVPSSLNSSSSQVSSSQSSTSQAVAPPTLSSSASTRSASTLSTVSSSKASSDSQVLTASSVSSSAALSSSRTTTSTVQTTFVTSTQAVPVSIIVENGSTTTTSLTTRTETPAISTAIVASSSSITQSPTSFILPSPPKQTTPSPLVPTASVPVTIQPTSTSKKIVTIPVIVTNIHTVTKKPIATALPMVGSSTSSPPTTSLKSTPTPIISPTTTSTTSTSSPPVTSDSITCIPAYCPTSITIIPSAIPTDDPISIGEPWSGMWTTVPPPLTFVAAPSVVQPASPRPELSTSTSFPAGTTTVFPPQSAYTPIYYTPIPLPQLPTSKPDATSISTSASTTIPPTSTKSYRAVTTYVYGTSSQQPSRSVVTVTSFLTPTTRAPTAGASSAWGMDLKVVALLAGLWVLIFVV